MACADLLQTSVVQRPKMLWGLLPRWLARGVEAADLSGAVFRCKLHQVWFGKAAGVSVLPHSTLCEGQRGY